VVDPKDFVTWLTTQQNAQGTLYLERTAMAYASSLRNDPLKLLVPLTTAKRNVYAFETVEMFERLRSSFLSAPNYKAVNEIGHYTFSSAMKCYDKYLASLAEKEGKRKQERIEKTMEEGESGVTKVGFPTLYNNTANCVDFSSPNLYANTLPVDCVIDGQRLVADKWSAMYVSVCEHLLQNRLKQLAMIQLQTKDGKRQPFLMDYPLQGLRCAKLSNGKFICTNYSTPDIIALIGKVLTFCLYKKENVFLTYSEKKLCETTARETLNDSAAQSSYMQKPLTVNLTEDERTALLIALEEKYGNGFKLDSGIDLSRLRRFALEFGGVELTLSDDELTEAVKACGTIYNGKVYTVSKETKERIKGLVDDYFADGATVIFYEEFYAKNEPELFKASVVSAEMLTDILLGLFPKLKFTQTYFGYANDNVYSVLEREILRIWGDDVLLNYGQIAERLRYIPIERVKNALGQNGDFVHNSTEVFTHVSRVYLPEEERTKIRQAAERECNTHRYVSVKDLPLDNTAADNSELSNTAIYNAVYQICLADEYAKSGKIITRRGDFDCMDALTIMRKYCRSLDSVSLDDLLAFEVDLTGERRRRISMQAGYDVLVRVNADMFFAEHHVHFDVAETDRAIEHFMNGGYVPLSAVTTFVMFPYCGQAWNFFLLESYCRRFSDMFRYDTPYVNNKNAGCIVRKNLRMTYDEIMADAVAKSCTPLNENAVADFLFNSGYRGSRKKPKLAEIIKRAKKLRERRN
jgi:hypothetical protein